VRKTGFTPVKSVWGVGGESTVVDSRRGNPELADGARESGTEKELERLLKIARTVVRQ
jgi:hypothetical protein